MEKERRRRIRVALWAYAYEEMSDPFVDDATFDKECLAINLSIDTNRPDLDLWFRENFNPSTGQWIHKHPDIERLAELYVELVSYECVNKNLVRNHESP